MRRTTTAVLVTVLVLTAACTTRDPPPLTGSPVAPSRGSSPSASPSPSQKPDPPTPFPADEAPDSGEATPGAQLSVTDLRIARQEGYDRVVLELRGAGEPGWRVAFTDRPRQQGSGQPVEVAGSAALEVTITGVGYPDDKGVSGYAGPRRLAPAGTSAVREVVLGNFYEGYYQAFVGIDRRRPFRVFRLADPPRVVIDVRTGSVGVAG